MDVLRTPAAPRARMGLRVDMAPGEFEAAIEQQGYRLLWEQAARCPCLASAETGHASLACPLCRGTAWEYHSPQEIRGIVDDLGRRTEALVYGEQLTGSAEITVRSEHRPGRFHRFTLLDSVMEYSEVRERRGAVERLHFPVARTTLRLLEKNAGGEEELVRRTVGVVRLRAGELLEEGVDFEVTPEGLLDWHKGDARGTAPLSGQRYAVTYYFHPRYVVVEFSHAIRDTQVLLKSRRPVLEALPVTVMARLDFLALEGGP